MYVVIDGILRTHPPINGHLPTANTTLCQAPAKTPTTTCDVLVYNPGQHPRSFQETDSKNKRSKSLCQIMGSRYCPIE